MSSLTITTRTFADAEVFDSQLAAVARTGFLIASSSDYNVHLGASGTYVFKPADQGVDQTGARFGIRFRDRPEIRVDSTRFIDTGSIDAAHAYAVDVEFWANWKSLFLQAENYWYGIERREPTTLPNASFSGYYVESSWILTGANRRYNMASGAFQNARPFVPFSRGGEQSIWTFGLNWYVNANLKFLLNYYRVDIDRLDPAGPGNLTPFGAAPATPPLGVQIGQDLKIHALRSQFSF